VCSYSKWKQDLGGGVRCIPSCPGAGVQFFNTVSTILSGPLASGGSRAARALTSHQVMGDNFKCNVSR